MSSDTPEVETHNVNPPGANDIQYRKIVDALNDACAKSASTGDMIQLGEFEGHMVFVVCVTAERMAEAEKKAHDPVMN